MSEVGKLVLSPIIPNFCNQYIPTSVKGGFPFLQTENFYNDMLEAFYKDLLNSEEGFNKLAVME